MVTPEKNSVALIIRLVSRIFLFRSWANFLTSAFLATTLCCVTSLPANAQVSTNTHPGDITGRITERRTGQPIADARVIVEQQGEAVTNNEGRYRLVLPAGTYSARIIAPGYTTLHVSEIGVTAGRTLLNDAQLDVAISESVEVRSGVFTESPEFPVSNTTLSRAEVRLTPGTGGDPLRAVNSIPSVTSASTEFADLIVRGGSTGENLTLIDNIPVDDFTYFTDNYDNGRGGRLGILVPEVFDRLEFSAGGFAPRYGDFMSSVLDIRLRTATRDRVQGVLFSDSGSAGLVVEVPLGARGGWLFSARRSYLDIALDIADIGDFGRPRNFDFTNKIDFELNARHKLTFTALNLFEQFSLSREEASRIDRRLDRLETFRAERRAMFGATLATTFSAKTFSQLTAWGSGRHSDGTFLRIEDRSLQRARDLRDSQFGIKEDLTSVVTPRLLLVAGGGLVAEQSDYYTFERTGFGFSPFEEEFNTPTRTNRLRLDTSFTAFGYGQVTWRPTARLAIMPGGRIDRYGRTGQTLFSPRVSARLSLIPRLTLEGSTGIYRQPPSLFVLSLTPENRHLHAQRAAHFIGGLEWLVREDLRLRVEAYQKSYARLIVQPTRHSTVFYQTGEGTARGLEVSAQKALGRRFSGQVDYSYTRSRRRLDSENISFRAATERAHQMTLIGITRIEKFKLATKFRVASGLPYTPTAAVEFRPGIFLQRIVSPEDRNSARLPAYANLDVRVERRFDFRRVSFSPYLDIFNLTGRDNNTELEYDYFSPIPFRLQEGRALPIFGARLEF